MHDDGAKNSDKGFVGALIGRLLAARSAPDGDSHWVHRVNHPVTPISLRSAPTCTRKNSCLSPSNRGALSLVGLRLRFHARSNGRERAASFHPDGREVGQAKEHDCA